MTDIAPRLIFCLFALSAAWAGDGEWPVNGGAYNIRYSPLTQVNRSNVTKLKVAWVYDSHDAFQGSEMQSNPIVVDGVMYLSMASSGGHLREDKSYDHGWFFQHTLAHVRGDQVSFEIKELQKKIEEAGMPQEAREKAESELNKLKMMSPLSAEATVSRNYIDWILALPWKKATKRPIASVYTNCETALGVWIFATVDSASSKLVRRIADVIVCCAGPGIAHPRRPR